MSALALQIGTRDLGHDREVQVTLAGELDMDTADMLERSVLPVVVSVPPRIVLDLADLTFCDSAGTRTIIKLARDARRLGTQLVVAAPRPDVRRIFEIVQLGQLLEIDG
jgi:anti-anti-sigma factor